MINIEYKNTSMISGRFLDCTKKLMSQAYVSTRSLFKPKMSWHHIIPKVIPSRHLPAQS